jgi:hypothetical protein
MEWSESTMCLAGLLRPPDVRRDTNRLFVRENGAQWSVFDLVTGLTFRVNPTTLLATGCANMRYGAAV